MSQKAVSFGLGGGMDLVTPAIAMPPGRVIASLNYEPAASGYRRFRGFERFDGQTAPSTSTVPATVASLRAAITAVPGSGPVRGIGMIDGNVVAFRDDALATAGAAYVESGSGWEGLLLGRVLTISASSTPPSMPSNGEYVTGNTSGATGRVKYITILSGIWGGLDPVMYSINVANVTGTFSPGETISVSASLPATPATDYGSIASSDTVSPFEPGGTFKLLCHNFFGLADMRGIYGVNGVGPAFEILDGYVTFISTGMDVDTPDSIAAYRNHLFLGYPGGQLQNSSLGEPFEWDVITGAGALGIGDEITGIKATQTALAIFGENSVHTLIGNDSSDFVLETLTIEAGALRGTVQAFGDLIYMDNRGIRRFSASRQFGNFTTATLSRLIAPLVEDYRRDGVDPVASLVLRAAEQYWVFFDNGTALVTYLGAKDPVILPIDLGITVTCANSFEDNGVERAFVGASNGFVYELNKGTSFDGDPIPHYIRLPFNNFGAPQLNKRVARAVIDVEVPAAATLLVSADLDHGAVPGLEQQTALLTVGGAAIDDLGENELYFASQIEAQAEVYFDSICRNFSLKIGGETDDEEPHTLTGVTFYIAPRALER